MIYLNHLQLIWNDYHQRISPWRFTGPLKITLSWFHFSARQHGCLHTLNLPCSTEAMHQTQSETSRMYLESEGGFGEVFPSAAPCSSTAKLRPCVRLYGLDFEEVQWQLQLRGGVSFLLFPFPGRGITSGFTQIEDPFNRWCQVSDYAAASENSQLHSGTRLEKGAKMVSRTTYFPFFWKPQNIPLFIRPLWNVDMCLVLRE